MTVREASALLTVTVGLLMTGGASGAQNYVADISSYAQWTSKSDVGDFVIGPAYANAPELTPRSDVPKGKVYRFVMHSTDRPMYPGIAKDRPGQVVPFQRRVTVYVPSQYVPGTPVPFLVSQDSLGAGIIPTILDNMIAEHRLPVMAAIMMDSGGGDAQGSERGLEYDTVSGRFAEYIESAVIPRASRETGVTFTKDPDGRMTMGGSSGGAAALSMAWFHPDLYHRVLSYSGTFVNQQSPYNPASPRGAWEYHARFIPESKRKPLRIWMHVGDHDLRYRDDEATLHNWVMANQRTAAALKAKGYKYQFVFAKESGHVDGRVVNQTLPSALEWVWRGYHPKSDTDNTDHGFGD
jgi:enterochelin esterase-like enzyme